MNCSLLPCQAMSAIDLILDHQLKWCVLVPISVAMVLVGLLCENLTFLLAPNPKIYPFRLARERYVFLKVITIESNTKLVEISISAHKTSGKMSQCLLLMNSIPEATHW